MTDDPEIPAVLNVDTFVVTWKDWVAYRKPMSKIKRWDIFFRRQLEWLVPFGPEMAVRILDQSMRQGWTGLFVVLNTQNHNTTKPRTPSMFDLQKRMELLDTEGQRIAEQLRGLHDRSTAIKRRLCVTENAEERSELNVLEQKIVVLEPQWKELCAKKRAVKAKMIEQADSF